MNMIFSSAAALAAVNANAVAADNVYPAVSISVLDHSRPDKHGYISYTEVSTIADLDRCVPPAKFSALNALYRNDFRKALLAARSAC